MNEAVCQRCGRRLPRLARGTQIARSCPDCTAAATAGQRADDELEALFGPAPARLATHAADTVGVYGPSGTLLSRRSAGVTVAHPQTFKTEGRLSLKTGGEVYRIADGETVVGREAPDVSLPDPTLSRQHFRIEARGGGFFLRDLASSNGTFLNGHRVRTAPLNAGDEIRAGDTAFLFNTLQVIPVG